MISSGGDASLLRKLNSAAILRALHQAEIDTSLQKSLGDGLGVSITELAAAAGVSRPTAEDILDTLLRDGWVDEELPDPSKPRAAGRPARRFRFRASAGYVVGIDLGSHSVLVMIADLVGTVVASEHAPVHPSDEASQRLRAVERTMRRTLEQAGIAEQQLLSAVVGTTGIIDASGRVKLGILRGWTGLDLAGAIGKFIPVPVVVRNDVRLGAVAERWRGAARGADHIVYIHAGVRMGSSFLIGGRLPEGFHGAAGELARGSIVRWVKAYNRLLEHTPGGALIDHSDPTPTELKGDAGPVFELAAKGDAAAHRAVAAFARELIKGVEELVVTIDPEVVVVGGSLSRAGSFVAEPIRQHLEKACIFPPRVAVSPLGENSVGLGAIRLALDEVEGKLFSGAFAAEAGRHN